MSSFPPIADYGFISDCENSCLIAPDGSIEWMCLPRPDAPSIFGALLDRTAGSFRFGPSNTHVPHQRRYLPGTMVMETTWHTPNGWLLVQDFLSMGPVRQGGRRAAISASSQRRRGDRQPGPRGNLHRGKSRGRRELRTSARLRDHHGDVGVRRGRISVDERTHRRRRPSADADEFDHARHGGSTLLRADHLGGG